MTENAKESFAVGHRVKLKSSSPIMIVSERLSAKVVKCIWFDREHHKLEDAFSIDLLIDIDDDIPDHNG